MTPRHLSALWTLAALALSLGAQPASAPFEPTRTSVDPATAARVAKNLVAFAQDRCRLDPDHHVVGDYRKIVRIAYALAPDEPVVATAHVRLRRGLPPERPGTVPTLAILAHDVAALADQAAIGGAPEDPALARWLFAVARMLDERRAVSAHESRILQGAAFEPLPWDAVLSVYDRTIPDGSMVSIHGLATLASEHVRPGQALRWTLTYRHGGADWGVEFSGDDVGRDLRVVAEEALRYWEPLGVNVQPDPSTFVLSCQDKYSPLDGGSAGAAFATLMRSITDPFEIDPTFAVTGDVDRHGDVLRVGGTFEKARAAAVAGCTRIAIPLENERELLDGVILHGLESLLDLEIHGVDTMQEVIALARRDRDERFLRASRLFTELRRLARTKWRTKSAVKSARIAELAGEIAALAPNHLTARWVGAWNDGTLPANLSLRRSIQEMESYLRGFLADFATADESQIVILLDGESEPKLMEAIRSLRQLRAKSHPDMQKMGIRLEEALVAMRDGDRMAREAERKSRTIEQLERDLDALQRRIAQSSSKRERTLLEMDLGWRRTNLRKHVTALERHLGKLLDQLTRATRLWRESLELADFSSDLRAAESILHWK